MAFLILVLALCAATVFITLGSWSRLVRTPLHARWLLVPVVAIPIVLRVVELPTDRIGTLGFGLYLAAYGLLLVFCLLNLSVRGMVVVAVGVALNALVLGLNHGMPTIAVDGVPVERTALHSPRESTDLLPWLGDVIVVPVTRETLSFGDLIIGVGLVNVVFWASRPRRRHTGDDRGEDTTRFTPEHTPTADNDLVPVSAIPADATIEDPAAPTGAPDPVPGSTG